MRWILLGISLVLFSWAQAGPNIELEILENVSTIEIKNNITAVGNNVNIVRDDSSNETKAFNKTGLFEGLPGQIKKILTNTSEATEQSISVPVQDNPRNLISIVRSSYFEPYFKATTQKIDNIEKSVSFKIFSLLGNKPNVVVVDADNVRASRPDLSHRMLFVHPHKSTFMRNVNTLYDNPFNASPKKLFKDTPSRSELHGTFNKTNVWCKDGQY